MIGEVSGAVERTHWYFNAKDADAVLACVMFASVARKGGLRPENGHEYILSGRVEYYAKGGKVSFIVDKIEPVGQGSLDAAFRRLCEELRGLGWFDPVRKKRLPTFPRKVAVITSAGGAALHDVLITMQKRCPAVEVIVADVRVQGDRAAEEVARAIRAIGAGHLGADAIIVTRGGGSKEDLWAFNERMVAEAIIGCPLPVVAAIGHETDTTIAELVADERASTPTQAAMRLTPDRHELHRQVLVAAKRLHLTTDRVIAQDRQSVRAIARHPVFRDPAWLLSRARSAIRDSASDLGSCIALRLAEARRLSDGGAIRHGRTPPTVLLSRLRGRLLGAEARVQAGLLRTDREARLRLNALERQLDSVGPRSVLGRGYSWTRTVDGKLVRSIQDVAPGDALRTQVVDGVIRSVVGQPGDQKGHDLRARMGGTGRSRSRGSAKDPTQLGLFPGAKAE